MNKESVVAVETRRTPEKPGEFFDRRLAGLMLFSATKNPEALTHNPITLTSEQRRAVRNFRGTAIDYAGAKAISKEMIHKGWEEEKAEYPGEDLSTQEKQLAYMCIKNARIISASYGAHLEEKDK